MIRTFSVILVTGDRGFIGSNLTKRFDTYYSVEIDNCYNFENIPWSDIEKIYHLGAISSTTETNISLIHHYNIDYSIRLFEKAIEYKIPVVYASSASVYGNSYTYKINPLNYYSLSKATVDYWVQDNMHRFVNVVGLRFFNVYGSGEDHKGSQASPIHQFMKQNPIRVFEDSDDFFRDFVWVEDCIDCMLMNKESGIYDVGTSEPISFQEVAELVADITGADIETIPFPKHLRDKYQTYTCARKHFDKKFISVEEYLTTHLSNALD